MVLAFAIGYYFAGDWLTAYFNRPGAVSLEAGQVMVSFIDVGQGDATLVRTATHAVLIDGGEQRNSRAVLDYLRHAGVTRLDYVVATHPHYDHIGGLIPVIAQLEIGRLLKPNVSHPDNTQAYQRFIQAIYNNDVYVVYSYLGYRLQAGLIDMVVVAPTGEEWRQLNNHSIALHKTHGQISFLFTADAEVDSERRMLDGELDISANVLRVGHHGSRTSTSYEFLQAVDPAFAVISLGANNRHGHPHREVMDRLQAQGAKIMRTDEMGTIRMITNGQTIELVNTVSR